MKTSVLRARINIVHFAKFKDDLQAGATSLLPAICIPTNMNYGEKKSDVEKNKILCDEKSMSSNVRFDKLDRFW